MIYTTLNKIRSHSPCADGWKKLLAYLGKSEADDEPLAMTTILGSNGLDDTLWCLRSVPEHDREWRLFACWCARRVAHLTTDPRVMGAIVTAERFARGECGQDELYAAGYAARAAAWDAAGYAARAAAGYAAGYAARAAAWDAAGYAARAAAWDAARQEQGNKIQEIFDAGFFTDKETTT